MPRDQDPELHHRPLHPEPGAAAVHPGPRLHPGDPLTWYRPSRSTRSSPTTTRGETSVRVSCAARSSSSCWPGSSPARCAGSKRKTCCSSRRPRAAWVWSGSSRSASSRRPTVARARHQHAEAARVRAQHGGGAQHGARRIGAVRHRHRPRARAGRGGGGPGRRIRACGNRFRTRTSAGRLRPAPVGRGPRPDDIPFDAADATLALVALSAKMRIDQIEPLDSIESITDGASSRRNQLLVDLGSELNLGAIDGAAEADLSGLKSQVTKLARTYKPYGPVLGDAVSDQLRSALGPSGSGRPTSPSVSARHGNSVQAGPSTSPSRWRSAPARAAACAAAVSADCTTARWLTPRPSTRRSTRRCIAVGVRRGVPVALPAASGGGATVDAAALGEFTEQITGRDGVLASAARLVLDQLGLDDQVTTAATTTDAELVELVRPSSAPTGRGWWRRFSTPASAVAARRPLGQGPRGSGQARLVDRRRGRRATGCVSVRFEGAGTSWPPRPPGGRARPWPRAQPARVVVRPRRRRCGEPGQGSLQRRGRRGDGCVEGLDRGVGGRRNCSTAAQPSSPPRHGSTTTGSAFYKSLYRDNARFGAVLWVRAGEHGVVRRHRRAGVVGRQ